MKRIAIVGGGISGLATGEAVLRRAAEAGSKVQVTVLESASSAGGKIKSSTRGGFVVETGPHGFLDKEPKMFELIERLGLSGALIEADESSARRFVLRAGKLREIPASPPKFLVSDILPFSARMRILMEPFARGRPQEEESVWEFAARRIGPHAADVLIDAMVTGIYGGDPKRLSLPSAFPRMFEIESQYGSLIKAQISIAKEKGKSSGGGPTGTMHSFTGGLGMLTDALAALEGLELKIGFEVKKLERTSGGFSVHGDAGSVEADGVVLAVPAFTASELLMPHAEVESIAMRDVEYAEVAVVVQAFKKEDIKRSVNGFGFLVPEGERRAVLGSIWASSVFPAHVPDDAVMLRNILGGVRHPEHAQGSDEELIARARGELAPLMGIEGSAKPLLSQVIRWPRGIPQYNMEHRTAVDAADAIETRLPGIFVTGNAFRGVAMLNCVAEADRVAARVIERLRTMGKAPTAA